MLENQIPAGPCLDEEAEEPTLHKDQKSRQFSPSKEAGQDLDVPAGKLCQERHLPAGQHCQQVEDEVNTKSAKMLNNLVSNVV